MPFESTAERHVQLLFDQVSFAVGHQLCDKEHTQLWAGWIVSSRNIVLFHVCLEALQKHVGCCSCYLLSHLQPMDFVYTVFSIILNLLKPAVHEVSKYPGATSIIGPRLLKRSKLHSRDPQILGTTAQI